MPAGQSGVRFKVSHGAVWVAGLVFVHEKAWDEPDLFPDHNEINSTAVTVHQ